MGAQDSMALLNKTTAAVATHTLLYSAMAKYPSGTKRTSTFSEPRQCKVSMTSSNDTTVFPDHESPSTKKASPMPKKYTSSTANRMAVFDAIANELTAMYQSLLDQHRNHINAAAGTWSSSTDPVLTTDTHGDQPSYAPSIPTVSIDEHETKKSVVPDNDTQHCHGTPAILNDSPKEGHRAETQNVADQLLFVTKQWEACEKGAYMMLEKQSRALEMERLRVRTLELIIDKQDELITALETQNSKPCQHDKNHQQKTALTDTSTLVTKTLGGNKDMICIMNGLHETIPYLENERQCDGRQNQSPGEDTTHQLDTSPITSIVERYADLPAFTPPLTDIHPTARASTAPSGPPREPLPPIPVKNEDTTSRASSSDTLCSSSSTSLLSVDAERHAPIPVFREQFKVSDMVSSTIYKETSREGTEYLPLFSPIQATSLASCNPDTLAVKEHRRPGSFWRGLRKFGSR